MKPLQLSLSLLLLFSGFGAYAQVEEDTVRTLRVDYSYNLRGWLTGIESGYFCQQLEYTEGPSPEYGGNVSRVRWQTSPGSPGTGYGYSYAYDGLDRLVLAQSLDSRGSGTAMANNHSAWYAYDAMGNVTSVVRNGLLRPAFNFGRVDELSLEYDGNRLLKVTDTSSETPLYHNAFHYVDGSDAAVEFAYDSNGNLTADLDKGVELSYNRLNLPVEAVCGEGTFACRYDRDGAKLVERFGYGLSSSDGMLMPVPVGLSAQRLSVSGEYRFDEAAYSGDIVRLRSGTGRIGDRADNLTGEELQVRHSDGYVSFTGQLPTYHYFIRDYQGNVVAVVSSEGDVEQRTHYYPYGGWYGESTEPLLQERKYGGKELELTAGVNWYDFGARLQRPDLCRFQTMDPLAEKYYGVSPYAYCMGNPIRYVDLQGDSLTLVGDREDVALALGVYNSALGGYYELKVDENGRVSMASLEKEGEMTAEQQEVYKKLTDVISAEQDVPITVQNGSNVLIGDVQNSAIDIGDMIAVGDADCVNSIGLLMHETWEQYQIKVMGVNVGTAHNRAIESENNLYYRRSGFVTGVHEINRERNRIEIPLYGMRNGNLVKDYVYISYDWKGNVKDVYRKY